MVDLSEQLESVFNIIINHSCKIKPGEKILIEAIDVIPKYLEILLKGIINIGAFPILNMKEKWQMDLLALNASEDLFNTLADIEIYQMQQVSKMIGLRTYRGSKDHLNIGENSKNIILKHFIHPVHYDYRNNHLKWIYFRIPSSDWAKNSEMEEKDFYNYYFRSVLLDYQRMGSFFLPLKTLLERTDRVCIKSYGTDLTFSIKGQGVVIDNGIINLPDGEVHTAPVLDSINGSVRFNIDSTYYGDRFRNVALTFQDGQVIKAMSDSNNDKLHQILNMDEGARYAGEFAIGLNPFIDKPLNDILFDEKIYGSFHLALGNSYKEGGNGNRSCIHWDLILDQKIGSGGGELYFDNQLIRKDGMFVHRDLEHLNPENLKKEILINHG